jgi:hypothetical protein
MRNATEVGGPWGGVAGFAGSGEALILLAILLLILLGMANCCTK